MHDVHSNLPGFRCAQPAGRLPQPDPAVAVGMRLAADGIAPPVKRFQRLGQRLASVTVLLAHQRRQCTRWMVRSGGYAQLAQPLAKPASPI